MVPPITLYGIASCEQCQQTKAYLEAHEIPFTYVNVDILVGEERNAVMAVLTKAAMFATLPTLAIGEKLLVGFNPEEIEKALAAAA